MINPMSVQELLRQLLEYSRDAQVEVEASDGTKMVRANDIRISTSDISREPGYKVVILGLSVIVDGKDRTLLYSEIKTLRSNLDYTVAENNKLRAENEALKQEVRRLDPGL